MVKMVGRSDAHVLRHIDGTRLQHRQDSRHHGNGALQKHSNPFSGTHAELGQQIGEPLRLPVELAVTHRQSKVDNRRGVRAQPGLRFEGMVQPLIGGGAGRPRPEALEEHAVSRGEDAQCRGVQLHDHVTGSNLIGSH